MPETYTQEQIDESKDRIRRAAGYFDFASGYENKPYLKAADIIISSLSTAERERDENKSKAEQYYKDWYASKAEFGDITAKLRDRVRTAEARVAELEARLQGAADRAIDFVAKHGILYFAANPDLFSAAIVGKKEGCTMMFEVIVTNKLLGNSRRIMSIEQIEKFNVCALACAKAAAVDGNPHTMGMWTVKLAEDHKEQPHA